MGGTCNQLSGIRAAIIASALFLFAVFSMQPRSGGSAK